MVASRIRRSQRGSESSRAGGGRRRHRPACGAGSAWYTARVFGRRTALPYITSDGTNLFLDVAGAGTPVVFLHGLGLDHRQWDPQWRDVACIAQAVRLDLRAHGRSAAGAAGDSPATLARDLQRALVQVGVDRLNPGFVIAHAHAADAALQAALAEPRALRGVVVVSPAVAGQTWSPEWQALWRGMRADAQGGRVGAALDRWRADAGFDAARMLPQAWAAIEAMHAGCSAARFEQETAGEPTTFSRLAGCRVPVLVVSGRRDRADFRQAAAAIAAALPHAELHEMDAGHFPNLERPVEFTERVRAFIAACP
jgi:pimeloyl-ACP methyl ester carboxylesterase